VSCKAYGPAGTRQLAPGHWMPTRQAAQTHRDRRFRPGADRFHTAKLPSSPSDRDIADTFSVDSSRSIFYPYAFFPGTDTR
jgi:hypothetical protein